MEHVRNKMLRHLDNLPTLAVSAQPISCRWNTTFQSASQSSEMLAPESRNQGISKSTRRRALLVAFGSCFQPRFVQIAFMTLSRALRQSANASFERPCR